MSPCGCTGGAPPLLIWGRVHPGGGPGARRACTERRAMALQDSPHAYTRSHMRPRTRLQQHRRSSGAGIQIKSRGRTDFTIQLKIIYLSTMKVLECQYLCFQTLGCKATDLFFCQQASCACSCLCTRVIGVLQCVNRRVCRACSAAGQACYQRRQRTRERQHAQRGARCAGTRERAALSTLIA